MHTATCSYEELIRSPRLMLFDIASLATIPADLLSGSIRDLYDHACEHDIDVLFLVDRNEPSELILVKRLAAVWPYPHVRLCDGP